MWQKVVSGILLRMELETGALSLEIISSVVKSDGEKTTIKMGGSDKYRGDFVGCVMEYLKQK